MAQVSKTETREVRAVARYVHSAPRKLRLVIADLRGKTIAQARTILKFSPKRSAEVLLKVLNSAVANAENNFRMDVESLFITKAMVDPGPIMYRWFARARGMANRIRKRTSHITIVVKESEG